MEENKISLLIISIVAIVAIVGIVFMSGVNKEYICSSNTAIETDEANLVGQAGVPLVCDADGLCEMEKTKIDVIAMENKTISAVESDLTVEGNLDVTGVYKLSGMQWSWQSTGTHPSAPFGSNTHLGFGAGASVTDGSYQTFVGYNAGAAVTRGTSNTFLGYNAGLVTDGGAEGRNTFLGTASGGRVASGNHNTLVGWHAGVGSPSANYSQNTIVGAQESGRNLMTGSYNLILGAGAGFGLISGSHNVILGRGAGNNAPENASHLLIVGGSSGSYVSDGYLGSDITHTAPQDFTVHASGGKGTNIRGANLFIAGGQSTGSGVPGKVVIQIAPAGASGSKLNPLIDQVIIDQDGLKVPSIKSVSGTRYVCVNSIGLLVSSVAPCS